MPANRPRREEGVVLTRISELVGQAENEKGAWPPLGSITFSTVPPERPKFAERVTLWAMVGLLGAVTIYAIAKGNDDLLKIVLTIAAGTLYRLTRLAPEKHRPGERTDDPRTKRRRKKRTPPD